MADGGRWNEVMGGDEWWCTSPGHEEPNLRGDRRMMVTGEVWLPAVVGGGASLAERSLDDTCVRFGMSKECHDSTEFSEGLPIVVGER